MGAYVERLLQGIEGVDRGKLAAARIGWDAGNGAAGPVLEQLVARLPGEHFVLFAEVDGHFPNHHPDPTIPENLSDLRALVAAKKLDFGCAFDGDGDRIGVVDASGRIISGDQLLAIYAEDLLRRQPNALVIADIKSSGAVLRRIRELGGRPQLWKSGHSQIKSRMKQVQAPLGGEMSGHIFFADDWYGFDDALYAALRLIAASVRLGKPVSALADALPNLHTTPELRFPVDEARKFAVVEEVAERLAAAGAVVDLTDGVRVDTADGWWLLRASNTQDVLVARAESETGAGLDRLLERIDAQLAQSGVSRT
jgi:phosphomannomutase